MYVCRLSPRHSYSFEDTSVRSSPNDCLCLPLGTSVLTNFNLPKAEVEFLNVLNYRRDWQLGVVLMNFTFTSLLKHVL